MRANFADGEPDHEQGEQLGDDHCGEDLEADGFFEMPFIGEHLCHKSQTGQRQDAGQSQCLCEIEVEGETDFKKVRRENEGDEQ